MRHLQVHACLLGRSVSSRIARDEMVEPRPRLVAERSPELPQRPVTCAIAPEECEFHFVSRHVGMWNAFLGVEQVVHVIVVDQHRSFGAEQLDTVGLALRWIFGARDLLMRLGLKQNGGML